MDLVPLPEPYTTEVREDFVSPHQSTTRIPPGHVAPRDNYYLARTLNGRKFAGNYKRSVAHGKST